MNDISATLPIVSYRDLTRRMRIYLKNILFGLGICLLLFVTACTDQNDKDGATAKRTDPYESTYKPFPADDTLFVNATILDGAGNRLVGSDILVIDGKIASIGPELERSDDLNIVDATGRWITPGIIDPHSHLGNAALPFVPDELPVWDVNETTDPNGADMRAEHGIRVQDPAFARALAGGVTTLHILPGSANLFGGQSVVLKNVAGVTVQDMKFPAAPSAMKMACGENPKFTYGEEGAFPASRMGVMAGMRRAFSDAKNGNSSDERSAILRDALSGETNIHIHCYRAEDMSFLFGLAQEFGFDITAIHHASEAYKIPDQFSQTNTCAVVWSDWWGYKLEAYDGIRANAAILHASGVCVALHSDSPSLGQRMNMELAKAIAAGRRAGIVIKPEEAIKWITLNPARVIGLDDQIGSLEPNKNADIVLWSGDPLSTYSRADMVMIDGAFVYDREDTAIQPRSDIELGQPAAEREQ
ncbi:amidohydrolase [Hyphococcus formosus]|uniref:amidohydrolase n=1 Tax=Hyphococcus formosus TaxID=3143534 RepID=UPI00398B193C